MRSIKYALATVIAALALGVATTAVPAQISLGVNVGPSWGAEPVCPYGYYDYAPYRCSPYGYYGPEWFNGGVFIGSGHWYRGNNGFRGHIDNGYDPRHGYRGPTPQRGDQPFNHFHGSNNYSPRMARPSGGGGGRSFGGGGARMGGGGGSHMSGGGGGGGHAGGGHR